MALTSGFFNSQVDEHGVADRLYDAEQMSSIFDGIIRDGVFAFIGDKFKVTVGGGNAVNIGTGRAWFDHVWILNDTVYPLVIPAAEVVLDRIDAVVFDIDRNIGVRNGSISVIKGIPSSAPSRPAMIRQEERNTYPIAYIRRVAGRSLTQADITMVIGTGETPFVTGPIETIGIDLFVDSMYDDWFTWFDSVKDILDVTPGGNLMNRIIDLETLTTQLDTQVDGIETDLGSLDTKVTGIETDVEEEFNRLANIGVAKLRMLTGRCTGSNTTVLFPAAWTSSAIVSVEIKNANSVWVTINNRYASHTGGSFYFTHDAGFDGFEYRVYILKTQQFGV